MAKVTLGAEFSVVKRQVITIELTTSMVDPEVDELIVEIPLLYGRSKSIRIPLDALITY
jgi:UDP-N-acetylglucosamine transferase subunit ALG13